ncbi:hypothetical protein SmJEL517_g03937 [Synchytrium microbalum]|uniref:GDP/GTP exchange factor Sec2 N-terminal domain-containing protein n=1 Tax=Synchytrium microbalum TaxID=1806994 RepID=A0A507BUE8_9FUNG|nr:uncharacterized protein SmJEL517_g03937 [Synchytrium microbalum]TPX33110.1 hypothetical protein SmJEL517_g03937 [Synchytrium microbalum]
MSTSPGDESAPNPWSDTGRVVAEPSTESSWNDSENKSDVVTLDRRELDKLERLLEEERGRVQELEAKNIELRDFITTANDKLQREKSTYAETNAKKNASLDALRVKLNRYEFAIKEAMVFLAKPQENYDEYGWLAARPKTGTENAPAVAPGSAPIARDSGVEPTRSRTGSATPKDTSSRPTNARPVHGAPPTSPLGPSPATERVPGHIAGHARMASSGSVTASSMLEVKEQQQPIPAGVSRAEFVQLLECMRLALMYLRNAYVTVSQSVATSTNTTTINTTSTSTSNSAAPATVSTTVTTITTSTSSSNVNTQSTAATLTTNLQPSTSNTSLSDRFVSLPRLNIAVNDENGSERQNDDDVIAGIVASGVPMKGPRSQSASSKMSVRSIADVRASAAGLSLPSPVVASPTLAATNPNSTANTPGTSPKNGGADEGFDEGDLAAGTRDPSYTGPMPRACKKCRELGIQLDHASDTLDAMKQDVDELADRLEEEIALRERVQLSKDMLDQELEQLTAQLFDQANYMVAEEARAREDFEHSNKELKGELATWMKRLGSREEELHDLRRMMGALEAAKIRSSSISGGNASNGPLSSPKGSKENLASILSATSTRGHGGHVYVRLTNEGPIPVIPVDALVYQEFQEHVRLVMAGSTSTVNAAASASLLSGLTYQTPFMKRCLSEDVEPTLFYSYHLTAVNPLFKTSGVLTNSYKRKLIDNITRGLWEIQTFAFTTTTTLPRSSGSLDSSVSTSPTTIPHTNTSQPQQPAPPKTRCSICSLNRDCEFRLRFPLDPSNPQSTRPPTASDWNPLCRFCRDRVCAVGDFCAYILHLRQGVIGPGKQGATVMGIFRHCLWLRRRMALARIGSCGLFEGVAEGSRSAGGAVIESGSSEWERYVQIVA